MVKENPLTTDLVGDKTLKTDLKVDFFGNVDELSAFIMEFIHHIDDKKLEMELRKVVNLLSTMMAEVAGGFLHVQGRRRECLPRETVRIHPGAG